MVLEIDDDRAAIVVARVGKTMLAIALGLEAVHAGYRVDDRALRRPDCELVRIGMLVRSLRTYQRLSIEGNVRRRALAGRGGSHGTAKGRVPMIDEAPEQRGSPRAADLLKVGQLTVRSERDGLLHTIGVRGELDFATADDVERELVRVEGTDALSIVVDLSGLTFIDSTGVRLLISAHARSRADSDRLTLLRGPRLVQRVFELTGVLDLLPFAD
ncbi:MAG TPA: anti-sigma factor antagonist [Solirubrobacteraceae bacterium]|nr:anti-sigma factor antagonist [Solirubrobacteraceae bacterium]